MRMVSVASRVFFGDADATRVEHASAPRNGAPARGHAANAVGSGDDLGYDVRGSIFSAL